MVTTFIVGMLCVHLLCFCVMFLLISTRLHNNKMGTDVFAFGNLLLGCAYLLQLLGGPAEWSLMSVVNHTLTISAPIAYLFGAIRFFNHPTKVWAPLLAISITYTLAQILVQWTLGAAARHALLAGSCALLFFYMTVAALRGIKTFAKDLPVEMSIFAVLIGGIGVLNVAKFVIILSGGMAALDMSSRFQIVFYIYMSFLGTVLPPAAIWLVLRRLTDDLRNMAIHDPLTQLLNRRGLMAGLQAHFRARSAGPVYLLIIDIDHFKRINDSYGHKIGDTVLCHVAQALQQIARQTDLKCRLGGEEFVVLCIDTDRAGAMQLAERIRQAIEQIEVPTTGLHGSVRCTATIGVSDGFSSTDAFDIRLQQADDALYRGKASGRNRVEQASFADVLLPILQAVQTTPITEQESAP